MTDVPHCVCDGPHWQPPGTCPGHAGRHAGRHVGCQLAWSWAAGHLMLVTVRWGSRRFEGVELDPTRKPLDFKRRLAELSGVEPPRQQLMVKGALVRDDDSWGAHAVIDGCTLLLVASNRPSCSDGASSTGTSALGCCARCSGAARTATASLWWLLINAIPLMFSFVWTMFDKNAGAAGNRIAVQRQTQRRRAAPPPRLVRTHHSHCLLPSLAGVDTAADCSTGPWARRWGRARRRWQRRRRKCKASCAHPFLSYQPVWTRTPARSCHMNGNPPFLRIHRRSSFCANHHTGHTIDSYTRWRQLVVCWCICSWY